MTVDQIKTSADTARAAISSAITATEASIAEADNLAQDAAVRGWEGVASVVMAAQNDLGAAAVSLSSAHDAADVAANAAAEITTQLAPKDIAERADGVINQHDQAANSVETANGSIGSAYQYALQVEADRLVGVVHSAAESITTARQSIEAAKATAEAERAEAANWGK